MWNYFMQSIDLCLCTTLMNSHLLGCCIASYTDILYTRLTVCSQPCMNPVQEEYTDQKGSFIMLGKLQYYQHILSQALSHQSFGLIPFFGYICNITEILCCIFKITKNILATFYITILYNFIFSSPNSCSISISPTWIFILAKYVAKRPLNHHFMPISPKDESLKCSEKNDKQTKTTRQKKSTTTTTRCPSVGINR